MWVILKYSAIARWLGVGAAGGLRDGPLSAGDRVTLSLCPGMRDAFRTSRGTVVIAPASKAEGRGFEPHGTRSFI